MPQPPDSSAPRRAWLPRALLGGLLMGLANLVPGISGGTMLLATGIYTEFVESVARLSTLKVQVRPLLVLAAVAGAAVVAIVLLAGPVKDLVVERRWVMYSLFIGLTLGGVPVVWRLARPARPALWGGMVGGLAVMGTLAWSQATTTGSAADASSHLALLFLAGLAGASAMILPGVSGGYLLLVLGQYVPILAAIDQVRNASSLADAAGPASRVLLPVGVGVVFGVVAVSNLLRWLLRRYRTATLGTLLGLLLGAVAGLWPFQRPIDPVPGVTVIKGRLVTEENLAEFAPEDYPTERFDPGVGQVAGSLALVGLGLAVTLGLARFGGRGDALGAEPTD